MARSRHGWHPGTRTKVYVDFGDDHAEPGDQLATAAGASYLVLEIRRSPRRPERWYMTVERLPYGSVEVGGEGVWEVRWYSRKRP